MPIHIKGANWGGEATELHLKQNGAYQEVDEAYTKVNGVWRLFHTAEIQVIAPLGSDARTASDLVNAAAPGLWASPKRKRLIVQGGERDTLRISNNFGGEFVLEVKPTGIISGGRNIEALAVDDAGTGKIIPVLNNGIIRGRGGNGGVGGQGGPGYYDVLTQEPSGGGFEYSTAVGGSTFWCTRNQNPQNSLQQIWWHGQEIVPNSNTHNYFEEVWYAPDGWVYFPESGYRSTIPAIRYRGIRRQRSDRYHQAGGAGGAGGQGIGYNIARTNGQDGQPGGTNAGRGGRGGDGGTWGTNGGTGATGASGNNGVGSAGAAGSSAYAIWGNNRISLTGNGTVIGARVNN